MERYSQLVTKSVTWESDEETVKDLMTKEKIDWVKRKIMHPTLKIPIDAAEVDLNIYDAREDKAKDKPYRVLLFVYRHFVDPKLADESEVRKLLKFNPTENVIKDEVERHKNITGKWLLDAELLFGMPESNREIVWHKERFFKSEMEAEKAMDRVIVEVDGLKVKRLFENKMKGKEEKRAELVIRKYLGV